MTERYCDEAAFQSHQTSTYGPALFKQMLAINTIEVEYYRVHAAVTLHSHCNRSHWI